MESHKNLEVYRKKSSDLLLVLSTQKMMLVMLKLRKTKELPPSPDIANPLF